MEILYSNFDSLFGKTSILYYMCFVFVVTFLKIETISSRNHLCQQFHLVHEAICYNINTLFSKKSFLIYIINQILSFKY